LKDISSRLTDGNFFVRPTYEQFAWIIPAAAPLVEKRARERETERERALLYFTCQKNVKAAANHAEEEEEGVDN
jgi:hypothetical protein